VLDTSSIVLTTVIDAKINVWLASAGKTEKSKLLYGASRDGWSASDFHRMCDGKGSTSPSSILCERKECTYSRAAISKS